LEVVREGVRALRDEWKVLLAYVGASLVLLGGYWAFRQGMDGDEVSEAVKRWSSFGSDLALSAAVAALQSVFFAHFAQILDRPLWKIEAGWDSLRRFFPLWFLLNLLILVSFSSAARPALAGMLCVFFLFRVAAIPMGACVMFGGSLDWNRLGELLAPLVRQPAQAGAVFFVSMGCLVAELMTMVLMDSYGLANQFWPIALMVLVVTPLECLTFCAAFLLCRYDRDTGPPIDYDF